MKYSAYYQSVGGRAFYRPRGCVSATQLADIVNTALRTARDGGAHDVLVNLTAMTGFETPDAAYRQWAVRRWAQTVGASVKVAVVAHRKHICPNRTGLIAAAESGMLTNIFETEPEAIAWLDHGVPEK